MDNRGDRKAEDTAATAPDSSAAVVVGIGASAGGLQALKRLLRFLPADSDLSFVVIQHLDPDHKSLMVELLGKCTEMPVRQVEDGMIPAANHVYVIPPNHYLELREGRLRLFEPQERRGLRMPVDYFFRSLARSLEDRAICILLSGTGSDGTLGLRDVKGCGGMAMVQSPDSAEYSGMPESAIATHMVDFVLDPEHMPSVLQRYCNSFLPGPGQARSLANADDRLSELLSLLEKTTGRDFRDYKRSTIARRVSRRMGLSGQGDLGGYLDYLRTHDEEAALLGKDLLIGVTAFFRDPEAYRELSENVLPDLLGGRDKERPLRIWCPGSASGEEAYSIAILVREALEARQQRLPVTVFASDIDSEALQRARNGRFPASISIDLSAERLDRNFDRDGQEYVVKKPLQDMVVFAEQNLIADPPFSNLDLIVCRNLLIYLNMEVQQRLIPLFHFALARGGYLFLGPSETVGRHGYLFSQVSKRWRIYRRLDTLRREPVEIPRGDRPRLDDSRPQPRRDDRAEAGTGDGRAFRNAEQALIQRYVPASVVINAAFDVLYFFGDATRYLRFPLGEASLNLLSMARQGLRTRLRDAVRALLKGGERGEITRDGRVLRDGSYCPVRFRVGRVPGNHELLLVSFEESVSPVPAPQVQDVDVEDEGLLAQLEYELRSTRQDLQNTIEELETSNEELKAAHEEAMSMNEELQSSNEELETSKEELQSLNEELTTLNSQQQERMHELAVLNDDLNNLLTSTDIATLFLDTRLCIKRYTESALRLFNIIPTDIGRPIGDISRRFGNLEMLEEARAVLELADPCEREVSAEDGCYYMMRILPYRTAEGRIEGVVITATDVTELRRAMQGLAESEGRFRMLFEKSPSLLCEQDWSGIKRCALELLAARGEGLEAYLEERPGHAAVCLRNAVLTKINEAALTFLGARSPGDLRAPHEHFGVADCEQAGALVAAIARGRSSYACQVPARRLSGEVIPVYLQMVTLPGHEHTLERVLVTLLDLSELKRVEDELSEKQRRLSIVLDNAADAIITLDADARIRDFNAAARAIFGYAEDEVIGQDVHLLLPRRGTRSFIDRVLSDPAVPRLNLAWSGRTRDGRRIPLEADISAIENGRLYALILRDVSERKRLEREVIRASAAEQERIGRELHDGLGQELAAMIVIARRVADNLELREQAEEAQVRSLLQYLESALEGTRRLAKGLTAVELENFGLPAALQRLAQETTQAHGIECVAEIIDDVRFDDPVVMKHLYRIAQQAMTNAAQHAAPRKIVVRLAREGDREVVLSVADDGRGISQEAEKAPGQGLRIMRYRADLIGAEFDLRRRADGTGTVMTCTLVLPESQPGNLGSGDN